VSDPDVYTLLVTNTDNGCTTESSIEVFQNLDTPMADAGPSSILTCATTSVTLDGNNSTQGPNIVYEWFNEGGVSIGSDVSIDVSQAGMYTILVTNTASNCTATAMVEISPDANLPSVDIAPADILTCATQNIQLDGGNSSSVNGTIYTLEVTDPVNGCSSSTTIEVLQDIEAPVANAGDEQILTCSQSIVTLSGSASSGNNLVYEWLDSDGMNVGTTVTVDVGIVGIYSRHSRY